MRENKWRAARYGLDAEIVVDEKGTLSAGAHRVGGWSRSWRRSPAASGATTTFSTRSVMAERPSYMRQRDIVQAGGSLVDVVDSLITELRTNEVSKP